MIYQNIKYYYDLPFEEYLALPGYSQSYLKGEINGLQPKIEVTDNMRLGSMVDAIITEPHKVDYNSPFFEPGKAIAKKINERFGRFIQHFEKQVSFTADAVCEGWKMPVRGRIDFGIHGKLIVDLKVTKETNPKDIGKLVDFMGYDNQLYCYAKGYGVSKAYLIVHFVKYKTTELYEVPVNQLVNEFWKEKIIKFGYPV